MIHMHAVSVMVIRSRDKPAKLHEFPQPILLTMHLHVSILVVAPSFTEIMIAKLFILTLVWGVLHNRECHREFTSDGGDQHSCTYMIQSCAYAVCLGIIANPLLDVLRQGGI